MPTAKSKNRSSLQVRERPLDTVLAGAGRGPLLPDIVTFAEDPRFLGMRTLYPRQKTLLRLIYLDVDHMTDYDFETIEEWSKTWLLGPDRAGVPPDIWERINILKNEGRPHFNEIEFIGGRRGGKGHIGAIIGAYQCYKLLTLDNPQWHYGISPTKDLYLFITATNLQQAQDFQFADMANAISNGPCFAPYLSTVKNRWLSLRTPADTRRIADMERRNLPVEREVATIRVVAVSSNSPSSRGAATFSLFFDEFAHMLTGTEGPRTGEEVYKALTPSLDQLGKDKLIYAGTSPYTKVGKAYSIYEDGIATSDDDGSPKYPGTLIIQLPSWDPYKDYDDVEALQAQGCSFSLARTRPPQLYDDDAKKDEQRDPEAFKVEKRAQWAEVIDAYLNPRMVDRIFEPMRMPDGKIRELGPQNAGKLIWSYRGHADPSESQANFAAAIGHTEPIPDPETGEVWAHVFIDWMHVWKPQHYADHQIPYDDIEHELADTISAFQTLKIFSYDQYGGFITVPRMQTELNRRGHRGRVKKEQFTAQSNQIRAERFKSAMGMNWVHSYKDVFGNDSGSLLSDELKFLQVKNGKVIKQEIGPVTTKDLADCIMVVTSELLAEQLDRFERGHALRTARVAPGAPGGYHTNFEAPPTPGSNRDNLRRFSNDRQMGRRWRGVRGV